MVLHLTSVTITSTYPKVETLDSGEKIMIICNKICRLKPSGYGDDWVQPPEGFTAGREGCHCTTLSILGDGSCICAPGDLSSPPTLRAKV